MISRRVKYFFAAIIFGLLISTACSAQESPLPYYVVIGGFHEEENARKFLIAAEEQNLPAVYAFNEARKMYYVYVRATQSKEIAADILGRIKTESIFKDAWVFNGLLAGYKAPVAAAVQKKPAPEKPVISVPDGPAADPVFTEEVVKKEDDKSGKVPVKETTPAGSVAKPAGKPFVFKLVNAATGDPVNGLVRLQESQKAAQFRGFDANETVYVTAPANKAGKWFMVCQVVGFRQYKKAISYAEPESEENAEVGPGQEVIIPLSLERVRRGDYVELDGVKFFHNTALFTPGSERELDELVAMMSENADYKVRLHGHTNGNETRDIVSLGESENFFSPENSNKKHHGTARELSLLRAELVKAYLVKKGIDPSRIAVKGEGGKQMIFSASGTLAGLNDRVEVEITSH